ncbi:MAG: response regulator [Alphaproteobacteria bacterium]
MEPGSSAEIHSPCRPVFEPPDDAKILVVDDDTTNSLILCGLLRTRGYRTCSVSNGYKALAMMSAYRFWAVFIDIRMPGIDGFETIRRMRELDLPHQPAATRVVGVSASVEKSVLAKAEGFDAFLPKPVYGQDLSAVLALLNRLEPSRTRSGHS